MGLTVQSLSGHLEEDDAIAPLDDADLYEEYANELSLLHAISAQPSDALMEKLMGTISEMCV
jgi:hypothetical protein